MRCNNIELVRAVRTQNRTLFDVIIRSKHKISQIKAKAGCKMLEDAVSLSLELESNYFFEKLMDLQFNLTPAVKRPFALGSAAASR